MIWMEGFDGPNSLDIIKSKMNINAYTEYIFLDTALGGTGNSAKFDPQTSLSDSNYINLTSFLPATYTEAYATFKFKWQAYEGGTDTGTFIFSFANSTGPVIGLLAQNLSIFAYKRTGTQANAISLAQDVVHSIKIYVKIADSGGRFVVDANGVTLFDFTGDTSTTGYTTFDRIIIGTTGRAAGGDILWFDHLVVSNSDIPHSKIVTYRPVADGNYAQFTPSTGTDHYALIDETTFSDADYVSSNTPAQRDSYKFEEYAATGAIVGVSHAVVVDKSNASDRTLYPFTRESSTDYDSSTGMSIGATADTLCDTCYEVNPATSAAWQAAELQGVTRTEFGVLVSS